MSLSPRSLLEIGHVSLFSKTPRKPSIYSWLLKGMLNIRKRAPLMIITRVCRYETEHGICVRLSSRNALNAVLMALQLLICFSPISTSYLTIFQGQGFLCLVSYQKSDKTNQRKKIKQTKEKTFQ